MSPKITLSFVFLLCFFGAFAQIDSTDLHDEPSDWLKPSPDEKSRLGVLMGIQTSTILGTALPNNQIMFGLNGGVYGRYNFKGGWTIQQQVQASFKGSNFSATGDEIAAMRMLYLDCPFLILKKLSKQSKHSLGLGIQYGYRLSTAMYINEKSYPSGASPKLDYNDWSPLIAYQYQFEYFALQSAVKYGLRDINLGAPWPDNAKPLNNGGSMHNFAVELNIIF